MGIKLKTGIWEDKDVTKWHWIIDKLTTVYAVISIINIINNIITETYMLIFLNIIPLLIAALCTKSYQKYLKQNEQTKQSHSHRWARQQDHLRTRPQHSRTTKKKQPPNNSTNSDNNNIHHNIHTINNKHRNNRKLPIKSDMLNQNTKQKIEIITITFLIGYSLTFIITWIIALTNNGKILVTINNYGENYAELYLITTSIILTTYYLTIKIPEWRTTKWM